MIPILGRDRKTFLSHFYEIYVTVKQSLTMTIQAKSVSDQKPDLHAAANFDRNNSKLNPLVHKKRIIYHDQWGSPQKCMVSLTVEK